jgi:outer membrane lipoprotein-sorting protein
MRLQCREACRALGLLATIGGLLFGASPESAALAGADLFDELYRRGQKQNADLRTLSASFTETTTSTLLTRPLVSRGVLAVERPSRVALRYSDPEERVVLIDGDRMTFSWPSRGVRQVKDIGASQKRIQKYFVNSSPDELRGHFQIAAAEANDPAGTYLITMVPKRKQILEGLSQLDLWVDRSSLLLRAMRMTFPNGDLKRMDFADVEPNAAIEPDMFKPAQFASTAEVEGAADVTVAARSYSAK